MISSTRRIFLALAILVFSIIAVSLYLWLQPSPREWLTVPVRRGEIQSIISVIGKIEAVERVNIGAQVSGQLKSLKVKIGDHVKKGQLIAEIDSLPQRNELRNAEAALQVARAELQRREAALKRQQSAFRRQQRMLREDASSQQNYEEVSEALAGAKADLTAQQARIVQAQIEVDKKRLDLSYTRIMAPMDGTVIAIITKQGQTVNSNQSAPTIARLARLDTMTVRAQISEVDINSIRHGQKVWFTIFPEPEKRYAATLRMIELAPESMMKQDAGSGTNDSASPTATNSAVYYHALLDIPNPDNKLRIAMTAQVSFLRQSASNALLIPLQAMKKGPNNRPYVEVINQSGVPEIHFITTGITDHVDIQVLDGLRPGDNVVLQTPVDEARQSEPAL
ncbi:efflux RND transporter periplasmic adaptor subunit [Entomohabitans teleogrylli]|uniref:efflux RND transporter periplasmic adaptor subunit n=1 Tax=Entomohabitans teleogrylli TaxID=1384589 RepID=UPI00073D2B1E|nr:efflux RND transporter periplasmic adaptor subunit [Entomohabitans teleogrylli]